MSKLSQEGASLLAAAREDWGSSPEAAARVRAALDARIAGEPTGPEAHDSSYPESTHLASRIASREPRPSGTRLRGALKSMRWPGGLLVLSLLGGAAVSSVAPEPYVETAPPDAPLPAPTAAPPAPAEATVSMPGLPVTALPDQAPPSGRTRPRVGQEASEASGRTRPRVGQEAAPVTAPNAGSNKAAAAGESSTTLTEAVEGNAPNTSPRTEARTDDLLEETRILRRAHLDLQSGRAVATRRALDEHEARFANGALREERLTLRVLLFCQTGEVARARAARDELERAFPSTSHAARLATSCTGTGGGR